VAVSDIALKKPLPEEIRQDVLAYVGCIAGAVLIEDYERGLRQAGFAAVQVIDTHKDLNAYAQVEGQGGCCSPAMTSPGGLSVVSECCAPAEPTVHGGLAGLLKKYDVNDYAASVGVYAIKAR
jgi:hypothetical protein